MTIDQLALYAPILVAVLAAGTVLVQLSKLLAKIDMIDSLLKRMLKLPEIVSGLEAKFDERKEAVDHRLELLEDASHCGNPDISA